ncbi:MAG: NVEALA domain-containing protein [Tannerella sp.]|jgi:hypothetical protein|nr:NVEALA domain-containing protein [Tannerella sp.]
MNKKKFFSVSAVLATTAVMATFNMNVNTQKENVPDILLENVEALANESTGGLPACMKENGWLEPADNLPICDNGVCKRKSGNRGCLDVNTCP